MGSKRSRYLNGLAFSCASPPVGLRLNVKWGGKEPARSKIHQHQTSITILHMGGKKITHTHTHACSHCPVSQTSLMPQRPAGLTGEGERTATPISRNTKRWRMRLIFQGFPLFLLSRRCWDFGGLSSCTGRVWSVTRKLCRAHGRKALPWEDPGVFLTCNCTNQPRPIMATAESPSIKQS